MRNGIERFVTAARRAAVLLLILCAFLLLLPAAPAAGAAIPPPVQAQLVRWDGRWLENVSSSRCGARVLVEGPQGPRSRVYLLGPGERKQVQDMDGERAVSIRVWAL